MTDETTPTPDDRRAAVCRALASAPGLLRYAARFAGSIDDAEDAYQRAMEIALTRAPVTDHERFMAWLRVVLRNEALSLAERRRREGPLAVEDAADAAARRPDGLGDVPVQAEWRQRCRSLRDALAGLTESQRVCVILQAGGASYRTIVDITGFSPRKVERSILEGRAALTRWEEQLLSGEACARIRPVLRRVAEGAADRRDRSRVSRHTRNCAVCRSLLREHHRRDEWLGMLAPVALLGAAVDTAPPDPAPLLSWIERLSAGATVRMGNAVQMALEMPGSAAAKAGGAAAAAVVAGTAGLPMVAGVVDRGRQEAPPIAAALTPLPEPPPPGRIVAAAAPPAAVPPVVRRRVPPTSVPRPRTPRIASGALARVARTAAASPAPAPRSRVPTAAASATAAPSATAARRPAVRPPAPVPARSAPPLPAPRVAGPRGITIGPGGP
ncbi:MAG TPA: RNA polymerase sigma factor [Miltoncostaeaceae bacterium]|nr:RNA polymerase sigma factor [Miltoncostaeaceae bacterium]